MQEKLTRVERNKPSMQKLVQFIVLAWIVVCFVAVAGVIIYKVSTQPEPDAKCVTNQFGHGCDDVGRGQNYD